MSMELLERRYVVSASYVRLEGSSGRFHIAAAMYQLTKQLIPLGTDSGRTEYPVSLAETRLITGNVFTMYFLKGVSYIA
jgi:hypothetical protein